MKNKKVLVTTGGAGAIGSAICMEMAKKGWQIAIIDISDERCQMVAAELNKITTCRYYLCNLQDVGAIEQVTKEIYEDFGRIDGLAGTAAITNHLRVNDIESDVWDSYMSLVIKAQFFMAKECARYMAKGGGGRIITLSSGFAYVADGKHTLYGVSKLGICNMTRNLAVDLYPDNIQANTVLPGYIITPLVAQHLEEPRWLETQMERIVGNRMPYPEDMAKTCAFLLNCKTPFLNGQEIYACSGYLDFISKRPKSL